MSCCVVEENGGSKNLCAVKKQPRRNLFNLLLVSQQSAIEASIPFFFKKRKVDIVLSLSSSCFHHIHYMEN